MAKFAITYDISDDRRRAKVARVLLHYGQRIQKSVFVGYLEDDEHRCLRRDLGPLLRSDDRLEMFRLDTRMPDYHLAWHEKPEVWKAVIVLG